MPAIQTTYNSEYAPAYVGMIADQGTRNVVSRVVQDATGLQFGVPVFQGTLDRSVTATPGTVFIGVSVADQSVRPTAFLNPDPAYGYQDTAAVITLGPIWVSAAVAVTAGQPVFVTPGGTFTDAASGDTAINAVFETSAAAGALVCIRLT